MAEKDFSDLRNRPLINCHTHIFTGDHVPSFLARTFLPWPFYYLVPVRPIVWLFRQWFFKIAPFFNKPAYRKIRQFVYNIRMTIERTGILYVAKVILTIVLTVSTFLIIINSLYELKVIDVSVKKDWADPIHNFFKQYGVNLLPQGVGMRVAIVLILLIFFKAGRNALWFVLKQLFSVLRAMPGPKSKELAQRYLNIGRYAFHTTQSGTWNQLQGQYPPDTAFIILPMDMEYMKAGGLRKKKQYRFQMEELKALKTGREGHLMFPFVFAEPRRIVEERKFTSGLLPDNTKVQLRYSVVAGELKLGDCFIREFIEDHKFAGFKIYPALGYYPFDEALLPLWKYAADNGLPILTHCIRGNIFYRGPKKKEWDFHPLLMQAAGDDRYEPMALLETENIDFINNFTHPLNYYCLLEEKLLRLHVSRCSKDIQEMFGFQNINEPMKSDLRHLKICFGHFGGDDEWDKFMELDRDLYTRQLIQHPDQGILFLTDKNGQPRPGKIEQVWKHVDWYSIICSLMLQYDHVYGDLSYILHNDDIHPLLKQTLTHPTLRERTLFGTDFYVVRNHRSEKGLLASIIDRLSEEDFNQIARVNPRKFLSNNIHGPVTI